MYGMIKLREIPELYVKGAKNMTKKRKIAYISIAAAIIVIAALAMIFMPKTAPQTVTEMLSTAQKYLVEMEYERAIAEFNKVIELDPMNADAYLGLAEAYEKSGDIDKAIETLKNGFELTGDERLQARLALLNGGNADNAEVTETTAVAETTIVEKTATEETTVEKILEETTPASTTSVLETSVAEQAVSTDTESFITIQGKQYSTNLTELRLSSWGLNDEDITELNKMTNLTFLTLWDNYISDINSLSELTNLTSLSLSNNRISDISALSKLTNLTELSLDINLISDISALAELKNLTSLELFENQISDITPLMKLTNLKYLNLTNNPISESDIEALKAALPNCDIMF